MSERHVGPSRGLRLPDGLREEALRARTDAGKSTEWCLRYQAGDPWAGPVLLVAHEPMIRSTAQRYSRPWRSDWEDFLQEGRRGLIIGAARFDPSKGNAPAYLWVRIRERQNKYAVGRREVVRLPAHFYSNRGDRRPLASVSQPRTRTFTEMEEHWSEEVALSFEDTLVDDEAIADELYTEAERAKVCAEVAWAMLRRLPTRQRSVLCARFRDPPKLLAEVGHEMGISRERARQVEVGALDACRRLVPTRNGEPFDLWLGRAVGSLVDRALIDRRAA